MAKWLSPKGKLKVYTERQLETFWQRSKNTIRVGSKHKSLGKHIVTITNPIPQERAIEMWEHLRMTPTNEGDPDMFKIYRQGTFKNANEHMKKQSAWFVCRKLLATDEMGWID